MSRVASLVAFLVVCWALLMLGFAITVFVTPPDPYTQLLSTAVILLLVIPVAYWLVYRRGLSFLD